MKYAKQNILWNFGTLSFFVLVFFLKNFTKKNGNDLIISYKLSVTFIFFN